MLKKLMLLFIGLITTATAFAQCPAAKKAATLILKPSGIKASVTQGVKQTVARNMTELKRANVASLREVHQLPNQQIAPTAAAGEQISTPSKEMDFYAPMASLGKETDKLALPMEQLTNEGIPILQKKVFEWALKAKEFERAKELLPKIELNSIDYLSNPLWNNILQNNMDAVIFLLENGADPNLYLNGLDRSITYLTLTFSDQWAKYLPILKKYGADFDKCDDGHSLLFSTLDDLDKTKSLIELGADPWATRYEEWDGNCTPYQSALWVTSENSHILDREKVKVQQVIEYYESLGFGK